MRETTTQGAISVNSVTHLLQRGDEQHGQRDQMQHGEGYQQEDHGCSPLKEESDVLWVKRRPCNFSATIRDWACNICFKTALWSEIKHCQRRPSVLDPPSCSLGSSVHFHHDFQDLHWQSLLVYQTTSMSNGLSSEPVQSLRKTSEHRLSVITANSKGKLKQVDKKLSTI